MAFINELLKSLSGTVAGGYDTAEDNRPTADAPKYAPLAQSASNTVVINGITLPQTVIDQLRQHGFNPEWCTPCELKAAEQEAVVDGTVFHDPGGNDFFDDLELTEDEKEDDDSVDYAFDENEEDESLALAIAHEQQLEQERYRMRLRVEPLPIRADTVKKDKDSDSCLTRSLEREKKCPKSSGNDSE